MKPFIHHTARSVNEASRLLKAYKGKARVNAGGTDLLGSMRDKTLPVYPEAVINIKTIEGLDYIKKDSEGIRIGALATLADVAASDAVKTEYALLARAAYSVASPNVRNMATLGGNLAQDVRCWYYRYPRQMGGPITCLRKGGKMCSALPGDNRYHSIFGAVPLAEHPCSTNCPAGIDVPAYLNRIRKNDMAHAARILIDSNPIPAVTGRVCPIFCETHCHRQELDQPVAINCVERGVGDYILDNAKDFYVAPQKKSGKKVAVIGSGPAGLTAAFYLRRAGHAVTVYERLPEAGGMLRFCIPPFRLPKDIVKRQIEALQNMGITFEVGVDVFRDVSVEELTRRFDAVFVAGGAWRPLKLGVPGEEARGVIYAIDYLSRINSGEKVALGKKVVVIGGGSVAIDTARTARRSGTEEVHVVCLECRDLSSKDRMLALDNEIREAEEEGIIIDGSLGVKEIIVGDGKAVGLDTIICTSVRDPDGAFNPQYDYSCAALSLSADSIIVAIGQGADDALTTAGLTYASKGTMSVELNGSATGTKGVFAGGDIVRGSRTVIEAIASAREAVHDIERFLGRRKPRNKRQNAEPVFSDSTFRDTPRAVVGELSVSDRLKTIDVEDVLGSSMSDIEAEAGRCFNCGCLAVAPSDIAVALVALDAVVVTSRREIPAEILFRASATSSTILETDELIREVYIPETPGGTRQAYKKFTVREPIDFAIVSVASAVTVNNGVCENARIVLGAVAPTPVRARAAEDFLKGKPINEVTATEAGNLALHGALPLSMNEYKVQIAKTLVKRAVLG
jgi:NADPH-dependent glutamate synthase beta subunit-like oxidoreductase/CO/xanthine dehydrogenase FAD-binding subunit